MEINTYFMDKKTSSDIRPWKSRAIQYVLYVCVLYLYLDSKGQGFARTTMTNIDPRYFICKGGFALYIYTVYVYTHNVHAACPYPEDKCILVSDKL